MVPACTEEAYGSRMVVKEGLAWCVNTFAILGSRRIDMFEVKAPWYMLDAAKGRHAIILLSGTDSRICPANPITLLPGSNLKMTNLEKAGRLIRFVGWLQFIGTVGIIIAVALPPLFEGDFQALGGLAFMSLLMIAVPLLFLKLGSALKQGMLWGKLAGSVVAALLLLAFPIGTPFGAATIYYLVRGWSEPSQAR